MNTLNGGKRLIMPCDEPTGRDQVGRRSRSSWGVRVEARRGACALVALVVQVQLKAKLLGPDPPVWMLGHFSKDSCVRRPLQFFMMLLFKSGLFRMCVRLASVCLAPSIIPRYFNSSLVEEVFDLFPSVAKVVMSYSKGHCWV